MQQGSQVQPRQLQSLREDALSMLKIVILVALVVGIAYLLGVRGLRRP
nr:hypothetical protein [uncultured Sphingomonas sp.]